MLPQNLLQQASTEQHGEEPNNADHQPSNRAISVADRPLTKIPIKRAALAHLCFLCMADVQQGDEIWPVHKPEGPGVNIGGKKVTLPSLCPRPPRPVLLPRSFLSLPPCSTPLTACSRIVFARPCSFAAGGGTRVVPHRLRENLWRR